MDVKRKIQIEGTLFLALRLEHFLNRHVCPKLEKILLSPITATSLPMVSGQSINFSEREITVVKQCGGNMSFVVILMRVKIISEETITIDLSDTLKEDQIKILQDLLIIFQTNDITLNSLVYLQKGTNDVPTK